jgi:hypothetical protein
MTDETRAAAERLAAGEDRIRLLDLPKAPRLGEETRDRAIEAVRGETVLYLSDDDLWLPDHARAMCDLLDAGNDLVVATQLVVLTDGGLRIVPHDYGAEPHRELLRQGSGRVALSALGHRRAGYGSVIPRWHTTDGTPSDIEFAREYLEAGGERLASTAEPTLILFPSPERAELTDGERELELERWSQRVTDPAGLASLRAELPELWRQAAIAGDARADAARSGRERAERLAARVSELEARLAEVLARRDDLRKRLAERNAAAERLLRHARRLREQVAEQPDSD